MTQVIFIILTFVTVTPAAVIREEYGGVNLSRSFNSQHVYSPSASSGSNSTYGLSANNSNRYESIRDIYTTVNSAPNQYSADLSTSAYNVSNESQPSSQEIAKDSANYVNSSNQNISAVIPFCQAFIEFFNKVVEKRYIDTLTTNSSEEVNLIESNKLLMELMAEYDKLEMAFKVHEETAYMIKIDMGFNLTEVDIEFNLTAADMGFKLTEAENEENRREYSFGGMFGGQHKGEFPMVTIILALLPRPSSKVSKCDPLKLS